MSYFTLKAHLDSSYLKKKQKVVTFVSYSHGDFLVPGLKVGEESEQLRMKHTVCPSGNNTVKYYINNCL